MVARTPFQRSLITALTALVLAPVALAAGESKNQAPFNRHVVHVIQQQDPAIQGEPKNEVPFTRILLRQAAGQDQYSDVFTRAVKRHRA